MQIGKKFKARIYGFDGEPAIDRDKDYALLQIAIPKTMSVPPGIVEVTLIETGMGDMMDTSLEGDT